MQNETRDAETVKPGRDSETVVEGSNSSTPNNDSIKESSPSRQQMPNPLAAIAAPSKISPALTFTRNDADKPASNNVSNE